MKFTVLLITTIICFHLTGQEHIVFSSINATNGLSDNGVRSIRQLHDGRMVFITEGMVNLYDGAKFIFLHYNDRETYCLSNFHGWHIAYVDSLDNIWLKNQEKLILFDVKKESPVSGIDSVFRSYGITDHITDFFMDTESRYWLLTEKNELYLKSNYSEKAKLFMPDILMINSDNDNDNLTEIEVLNGEVFFLYTSGEMICFDIKTKTEKYRDNPFGNNNEHYNLTTTTIPSENYFYLLRNGKNRGISLRYNTQTRLWENIMETEGWQNTLTIDSEKNIWISTFQGLWEIDEPLRHKQILSPLKLLDGRQFETEITSQYNDNSGGLWVGSINRGVLYYHPGRFKFRNFGRTFFDLPENTKLRVTDFEETDQGILVGTLNGVYILHNNSEQLTSFNKVPKDITCNMMLKDSRKQIWMCTQNYGLYCLSGSSLKHYSKPISCQYLYEALDGNYYLCTNEGLGIIDPATGNFEMLKTSLDSNLRYTFYVLQYGENKLIGYSMAGAFFYDCTNKTITFADHNQPIFQQNNFLYNCMYTDSRGLMWFGTQDGLYVYDPSMNTTQALYTDDGLVNNAVRSLIEDNQKNIWASTSNGISCITVFKNKTEFKYSFMNYNHFDGLIENEFLAKSVYKTSDNKLFWGGLDGFNKIDLEKTNTTNQTLTKPLITGFKLFGNEIRVGQTYGGKVVLAQSISSTKQIILKHFQNFISFEFSALNYINPTQTYYKYILEGIDADWNIYSANNGVGEAVYTNLLPGSYTLKVYAANNSRQWTDNFAEISIVIQSPIWLTPIAYFIYLFLFVGFVAYIINYYISRNKKKILKKQDDELAQLKLSFYTNSSHELRTPLTLILTPLDSIIKNLTEGELKEQLTGIYNSANNLLKQLNQLLDFRKLEMNREILQISFCNVDEFLKELICPFIELANGKEIAFNYNVDGEDLYANVDKNKLKRIVNNLLSNALKFTSKGGCVELNLFKTNVPSISNQGIVIQVVDSGCGIGDNEIEHVFERFYQGRQNDETAGSGIGLHLVKEYVDLHNGTITVKSTLGKGSVFTVELPVNMQFSGENEILQKDHPVNETIKILMVDDSDEFIGFLTRELRGQYKIITASNGEDGVRKAKEQHPDLIISDIKMPKMSGTELCNILKNDIRTSHIPVILLTAITSEDMQVEAFRVKADAYITKPFNMEVLQLRIQNLIDQQEKRKSLFKNAIILNPETLITSDIDKDLINKVLDNVEKNMNNTSYSVEQLSNDMFMDRTGLYRKLVAIAGQTPTEFMRSIRLKKASHLLKKGQAVYEVSESVGFSSTSYFIKCFQKEFGVKPSEYKNKNTVYKS